MARTAQSVSYLKAAPKDLPDGVVQVEIERKLKNIKPDNAPESWSPSADSRVFALNVPTASAAGVVAFPGFLSDAYGIDGPVFCAEAIRNAMADRAAAKLELGREKDSLRFVPAIAKLRTVNKGEVIGALLSDWINAHPGEIPPADVLTGIYKGISI